MTTPPVDHEHTHIDGGFGLGFVIAFLGYAFGATVAWATAEHVLRDWLAIGAAFALAGLVASAFKRWSLGSGLMWGAACAGVVTAMIPWVAVAIINPE